MTKTAKRYREERDAEREKATALQVQIDAMNEAEKKRLRERRFIVTIRASGKIWWGNLTSEAADRKMKELMDVGLGVFVEMNEDKA